MSTAIKDEANLRQSESLQPLDDSDQRTEQLSPESNNDDDDDEDTTDNKKDELWWMQWSLVQLQFLMSQISELLNFSLCDSQEMLGSWTQYLDLMTFPTITVWSPNM